MKRAIVFGFILAMICAPAEAKPSKDEQRAVSASPSDVADMAEISDDPYQTKITVSTRPFFISRPGFMQFNHGDKFIRAFVDRKSGNAVFQIYTSVTYLGEWQFIDRYAYLDDGSPVAGDVVKISRDVGSCGRYTGCSHTEVFGIEVPEGYLRKVSSGASGGVEDLWNFKIYGKFSEGIETGLLKTEIAGAVLAVDRLREKLKAK